MIIKSIVHFGHPGVYAKGSGTGGIVYVVYWQRLSASGSISKEQDLTYLFLGLELAFVALILLHRLFSSGSGVVGWSIFASTRTIYCWSALMSC